MQTFHLGEFGVRRIGFGAMQLPGRGVMGPPRDHDEAIAVLRRVAPEGSKDLAEVLWWSGTARLEAGDPRAARGELEEAVEIGTRLLAPDHPFLNRYRRSLERCAAAVEQDEEQDG